MLDSVLCCFRQHGKNSGAQKWSDDGGTWFFAILLQLHAQHYDNSFDNKMLGNLWYPFLWHFATTNLQHTITCFLILSEVYLFTVIKSCIYVITTFRNMLPKMKVNEQVQAQLCRINMNTAW